MTSYRTYTTTICPWIFQARPGRGSAGRGFITQWCGRMWQGNDPTGKQGSRPARSLQRASSASKGPGQGRHAAKGKGAIRKLGVLCSMRQVRRVASSVLCSMCQARRIADHVSCSMRQERHDAAALKDWDVLLCAKEICAFVCMCWKTLEKPVTHFSMAVGSSRESGFSPARAVRLPFCASRVSRGSLPAYRGVRGSTAPSASVPGQQRARPRHIVQASPRDDARGSCTSRTSHERRQRGVPCELLARVLHSHAAGRAAVWPQLGASKRAHGAPVGKAHQTDRASTHPGWGAARAVRGWESCCFDLGATLPF